MTRYIFITKNTTPKATNKELNNVRNTRQHTKYGSTGQVFYSTNHDTRRSTFNISQITFSTARMSLYCVFNEHSSIKVTTIRLVCLSYTVLMCVKLFYLKDCINTGSLIYRYKYPEVKIRQTCLKHKLDN